MSAIKIEAKFGPPTHDRSALSGTSRHTLEALYRHPIAHNLAWLDVFALFTALGSVQHGTNNEVTFSIGDIHHRVSRSHDKDVATEAVMDLRHMLNRAGWGPGQPGTAAVGADAAALSGDVLVVVEAGEARLFQMDLHAADITGHPIHPDDPNRILRHLSHQDQGRDEEKRAAESAAFHNAIAHALGSAGRIVLVGHGEGHSNAAQALLDDLKRHHPQVFQHVAREITADIGQMTDPQLLARARKALT